MMDFGSRGYRETFKAVAGAVVFLPRPRHGDVATTRTAGEEEGSEPNLNAHASGWVGRLWQSPFCFLPMPVGWKETGFLLGPYPGKRTKPQSYLVLSPECLILLGTWYRTNTWGHL